ncbi:hypothetical protein MVEG_10377 [Podila verticillata NRRL 6337]|nr:hypothetical protein MVEG_10377 [Podila verticillata NRRL 6337]
MSVPEIAPPEPVLDPSVYAPTAKPKPPLTEEELANLKKPKVMIVGAGIGGLTLGILLKKGGIPFEIYERAKEVKSLGSGLLLGSNLTTLLKQLGIYEEFHAIGKPVVQTNLYNENIELQFSKTYDFRGKYAGGDDYIMARPDLYDLLLRQIPKERLHLGKRVISFEQNREGVMIRCTDNTSHHGDILVGSDGAHSAIRQHLFHVLKKKKVLPASDDVPLPFTTVCLVGQTRSLDPEEYPMLKTPYSEFWAMMGSDTPYSWSVGTTIKNTFCFNVVLHLDEKTAKENDVFRNSEWGPEAAEAMCKEVRHLRVPGGKDGKDWTIGDIIDLTPKELISKVMLEEKLFSTWYGGRTVLLGDSCHKFNPAGAAGALTAMHDAVALANWICALYPKKPADIDLAFKEYYNERFPIAKEAFAHSQLMSKMVGKNLHSMAVKNFIRRIPSWLWKRIVAKSVLARPQASFLPLVEDKGTKPAIRQPSLYKTLPILEKRAKEEAKNAEHDRTVAV